ncbi:MAG: DegV family protein [bacterium]|nr:DegV family protein [bacterium]
MKKIAIVTDSNSGITQEEAKKLGVFVLPMPFYVNGEEYLEGTTLTHKKFYELLENKADISTSQPSLYNLTTLWDTILEEYDELVHIPMSSALSSSCEVAMAAAQDYDGKVHVVDNLSISVTQKLSVLNALTMRDEGKSCADIKNYLEASKYDSTIYITLNTLYYLKKGGRLTPAAAALGTLLQIKPVLQIQGGKLDSFSKARTMKKAKSIMMDAVRKDAQTRFHATENFDNIIFHVVYSGSDEAAKEFQKEVLELYPQHTINIEPLSLSIACHIGPGALALTASKKYQG